MRGEVADDIGRIYNADDPAEADRRLKTTVVRYHKTAPGLASWLEENIPETLEVFAFPAAHRKRREPITVSNDSAMRSNAVPESPPCSQTRLLC